MPEEVKLSSYTAAAKDYKSDCSSSADDSHPESSIYADHSDREMSRSETSSCSDESSCYKQNGHEAVEIIPTRTIKTSVPKPAANPLQFVKIGPCDLYRSAQKQIQKVSDVKKSKKEVKDETAEDWQSNLDSWKCNRRKQQEHIIERVVEVKKLELEDHDRNRRRTKTFSEMMEERTSKGRKTTLPVYLDNDNDDLSDLGLSANRSRGESSPVPEGNDEENSDNGHDDPDRAQTEDTYESAIHSYETRMKSLTSNSSSNESKKFTTSTTTNPPALRKYGRRASSTKIEEKLSELERIKNRSISSTDLSEANKKSVNVPKVNIFQRKEMFEKISDANKTNTSRRLSEEIVPVRSIRDRLSSLGKTIEETTITPPATPKSRNLSISEISVKDRLSSINKKISEQSVSPVVPEKRFSASKVSSVEGKSKALETPPSTPSPYKAEELLAIPRGEYNSSGRSSSSEDYDHVHQMNHFYHRSLDSLQGHDSPNSFCFERVQSLEYIDCCSNYPASVLSADTDREDSGIHTADVSSSVSQADDFDLHLDVDVKSQNAAALINDDMGKADKSSHSDFCLLSQGEANIESSLDEVAGHMDVTVISCDDRSGKLELEAKEGIPQEGKLVGGDDEAELKEMGDEHPKLGNQHSSRNDAVEPVEEECWMEDCKSEEEENNKRFIQDNNPAVEEEISPVLNREHLDKPSIINQNFNTLEQECISTLEVDASSQNFDYMYTMNNKLAEESANGFPGFPFDPSSIAAEPPKEKPPPPPPTDNSDGELEKSENTNGLRRIDSTKRIKKEIRLKRSSFLGIEGYDDDSYLEPELEAVKPPPDMTTFLQEERRLEKLLYRQSICSESDSTQGESRDSGVELDKNHNEENSWTRERTHTRQDSEIYANTSTTSEEDEIIKKEKEILEILELEEQRNYETGAKNGCDYLGEKLVLKLKELKHQKNAVYWNQENERLCIDEQQIPVAVSENYQNYEEQILDQRRHQLRDSARQSADSILLKQQWAGSSLQDINKKQESLTNVVVNGDHSKARLDYRNSMPNIQQEVREPSDSHQHKQPPPIPANKPTHYKEPQPPVDRVSNPQQMSKQTLQALSAVPRSKIVATDSWVQTKKKPRQEAYNYQHWLIQEAEHRRITEYQQRQCKEKLSHDYINVYPAPEPVAALDNRIPQQHPTRLVTYPQPQMLPYRNQSQNGYSNKSQTKTQCSNNNNNHINNNSKPLPDSVIQTLTQRVQNRFAINDVTKQRRQRESYPNTTKQQEKMLSVSGKKKCSHCGEELGRGAAMIIESLRLFYHIDCFRCCVCCVQLGDGLMGTDVRVRNSKLHCHSCYSNDEGLKFSCV